MVSSVVRWVWCGEMWWDGVACGEVVWDGERCGGACTHLLGQFLHKLRLCLLLLLQAAG